MRRARRPRGRGRRSTAMAGSHVRPAREDDRSEDAGGAPCEDVPHAREMGPRPSPGRRSPTQRVRAASTGHHDSPPPASRTGSELGARFGYGWGASVQPHTARAAREERYDPLLNPVSKGDDHEQRWKPGEAFKSPAQAREPPCTAHNFPCKTLESPAQRAEHDGQPLGPPSREQPQQVGTGRFADPFAGRALAPCGARPATLDRDWKGAGEGGGTGRVTTHSP